jgi:hypothetical protein
VTADARGHDRPCPLCGWSARHGDHICPGSTLHPVPHDLHPALITAWRSHRQHPSAVTRRALARAITLACADPRCDWCDEPYPLGHPLQRYCSPECADATKRDRAAARTA